MTIVKFNVTFNTDRFSMTSMTLAAAVPAFMSVGQDEDILSAGTLSLRCDYKLSK